MTLIPIIQTIREQAAILNRAGCDVSPIFDCLLGIERELKPDGKPMSAAGKMLFDSIVREQQDRVRQSVYSGNYGQ